MRLAILLLLLLCSILLPFALWGEQLEAAFSLEGVQSWLKEWGHWAWLAGVGLIIADLFLPLPSTVVMSVLGWSFGWLSGGLASSLGSFLAGMLGYGLCRLLGRRPALWLAGQAALSQAERLFSRQGYWLVALSRCMPVLPEAVSALAGLVLMPLRRYMLALACGSVPVGFTFAAVGHLGQTQGHWALLLSAVLPVLLWILARRWLH